MAKRFTDTVKWEKVWFRKLSLEHKCFWFYLLDRCNHAGIWDVDFEFAQIYIGAKIDRGEVKAAFGHRIRELNDGKKWQVMEFVEFQYKKLNHANRAHLSVFELLQKEGATKGLTRALLGVKDKAKAKDKDKDKDKAKDKDQDLTPEAKKFMKKVKK